MHYTRTSLPVHTSFEWQNKREKEKRKYLLTDHVVGNAQAAWHWRHIADDANSRLFLHFSRFRVHYCAERSICHSNGRVLNVLHIKERRNFFSLVCSVRWVSAFRTFSHAYAGRTWFCTFVGLFHSVEFPFHQHIASIIRLSLCNRRMALRSIKNKKWLHLLYTFASEAHRVCRVRVRCNRKRPNLIVNDVFVMTIIGKACGRPWSASVTKCVCVMRARKLSVQRHHPRIVKSRGSLNQYDSVKNDKFLEI